MPPLLIALLPFLGALLPGIVVGSGRSVAALATALPTALALVGLGLHLPALARGEVVTQTVDWLPRIGLDAAFRVDGLSAFFAALILGIGLLITLYARFYLAREDGAGRFFTFLLLFQGAMTGLVLSDNLLLLLVFWELTSLSSFLLIGYWGHRPEARRGARMALGVTALGGLAMIAGMLILGQIAGSMRIGDILEAREAVAASPLRLPAMLLILAGAFAKSAQVPFHFWLPRAMAAPTPVSAYLHSATMVKAGLFLMARLWPVFAGTPEWFWIVSGVGLATMLAGAAFALTETDLKGLLAWSTVSHLGLVTMLLGIGTVPAATVAMLHILNHALFKAPLFMVAGIVEHETHSRDLRTLGGLARRMPLTFALALLAGLSMAGVPLLGGFVSKEAMLAEVLDTRLGTLWLMPALAGFAALLSAAYSFRFLCGTFLGRPRSEGAAAAHDPGPGLWLGPAILVLGVVAIGLAPMLAAPVVDLAASAVTGSAVHARLAVWHGLNPALGLSATALIGGAVLLGLLGPAMPRHASPFADAARLYWAAADASAGAARRFGEGLQSGSMAAMLAVTVAAALALGLWAVSGAGGLAPVSRPTTPVAPVALVAWALLMVAALALGVLHRDRLLALVLVGIVGLMVSLGFAWLSAPDLALTQVSVEVVTIMLMLLALNFLPKRDPAPPPGPRRLGDIAIAAGAGLGMAALAHALMRRDFAFPTISAFHAENSYTGGGGHNIVNVILVDFRGYDTFGEITVLGIAALAIAALAQGLLADGALRRVIAWRSDQRRAGDRHPLLMIVATRLILPFAVLVGVYIFLRGHNAPGGGFVAGLVFSIALLMQYMASGYSWAHARVRFPYHMLIGAGVAVAAATGIGAWFGGTPFMTSAFGYVTLPGLEPVELATAALFDLGVFLTVLGAVMLALASMSRLAVAARSDEPEEG